MRKKWNDSPLDSFDYPEFDETKHLKQIDRDLIEISKCIFNTKNSNKLLDRISKNEANEVTSKGSDVKKIIFFEVLFDSSFESEAKKDCEIEFQNCNFYKNVKFENYNKITLNRCFSKKEFCLTNVSYEIQIDDSRVNQLSISSNACESIEICDSYVETFNMLNNGKTKNDEYIKEFYFKGYIKKELYLYGGQTFESFDICCDSIIDNKKENSYQDFGKINIWNGRYLNSIHIKQVQKEFFITDKFELKNVGIIEEIHIDLSSIEAEIINISNCNISTLKLSGNNYSVPVYISDIEINEILFEKYQMDKEGTISFRNIKNQFGLLESKDSLISNKKLFFQACDLSEWESHFTGTFFEYQAISSSMPTKIKDERDLSPQQKLDIHNMWLKNTNKDENIINWHNLKRKQFQTIWEVEKGKLDSKSNGLPLQMRIQKFVQELNDYGTNWWKPFFWIITINLIAAIFSTFVLKTNFESGNYFLISNFISFIYPLDVNFINKEDFSPFFKLFFIAMKIINATLIFQIISAFRVYYRK